MPFPDHHANAAQDPVGFAHRMRIEEAAAAAEERQAFLATIKDGQELTPDQQKRLADINRRALFTAAEAFAATPVHELDHDVSDTETVETEEAAVTPPTEEEQGTVIGKAAFDAYRDEHPSTGTHKYLPPSSPAR